jgi:pyruvate formate lyase activating enzyme
MKKCDLKGSIDSIETLGLVDGPGIRTVVFLNGCKLRCLYCHNPEMWKIKDYNMTVDELVNKILRYKPYYKDNGGVTFSGGEPLLQSDYLLEVCKRLKKEKINIALDTAGVGNYNEKLLDYIDLIIFDIKAVKSDDYNYITGYKIDESLKFLNKCQEKNIKMWIRQVIVPKINDNEKNILELKKFISKLKNVEKVELLPYHTMAIDKYKKLGIEYKLTGLEAMNKEKCKKLEKLLLK